MLARNATTWQHLAILLTAVLLAALAPAVPAQAATAVPIERIAGADRIQTAIRLSQSVWSNPPTRHVLLARADAFADALAAGPLARQLDAPILLTPSTALPTVVADELRRLAPQTVSILGGEAAVSADVASAVSMLGPHVQRLAGATRSDTARAIGQLTEGNDAVIVSGRNFADALSATSLAPSDIVLAEPGRLPDTTGFGRITLVGAAAGMVDGVADATRLAGADRYRTNLAVLREALTRRDGDLQLVVATGEDFPDALAAGALTHPILLVHPAWDDLPADLASLLEDHRERFTAALVFGGEAAVPMVVQQAVARALSGDAAVDPNTPGEPAQPLEPAPEERPDAPTADADDRTLALVAERTETPVGDTQTVVAQITSEGGLDPADVELSFQVDGEDLSGIRHLSPTQVRTGADGSAVLELTSTEAGEFLVTASFVDAHGEQRKDTVTISFAAEQVGQQLACGMVVTHDITLQQDLVCPAGTAMHVPPGLSEKVTIDLNGHRISGPGEGVGIMINVPAPFDNTGRFVGGESPVEVRNGTLSRFRYAILDRTTSGQGALLRGLSVTDTLRGVFAFRTDIADSTFSGNGTALFGDVRVVDSEFVDNGRVLTVNYDWHDGGVLQRNRFLDNDTVFRFESTQGSFLIEDNAIDGNGTVLSVLASAHDVVFRGNMVRGNDVIASSPCHQQLGRYSQWVIQGNTFEENAAGFTACPTSSSSGNRMQDNVFTDTGHGSPPDSAEADAVHLEDGAAWTVTGNAFINSAGMAFYGPGATDGGGNSAAGHTVAEPCVGIVCAATAGTG